MFKLLKCKKKLYCKVFWLIFVKCFGNKTKNLHTKTLIMHQKQMYISEHITKHFKIS